MQSRFHFRAVILLATIWLSFGSPMAAQRRPSTPGTHGTELEIRLTTEDPGGTPDQIRVLLTTSSGSIVADRYSGAAGNVTFSGLPSGNYRVKASGMEIEE